VAYGIGYVGADLIAEIAFTKGIGKLGKLEKIKTFRGMIRIFWGRLNKYFINKYGENNVIWESNKVRERRGEAFLSRNMDMIMSR
jgi:hypothetical protein